VAVRKQQEPDEQRAVQVVEPKTEWTAEERRALVKRVYGGDKGAVPELRRMFAAHPATATGLYEDLDQAMRRGYIQQMVADDALLQREVYAAQMQAQQQELEGEHPTALERVLVAQIVTARLALMFAQVHPPAGVSALQQQEMIDLAAKRLDRSVLTLAKVRRLLRPQIAQVNIAGAGAQQLNVAGTDTLP
jgi:hypothetical protein